MTIPDLRPIHAFLDERHALLAGEASDFAAREVASRPEPRDDDAARRDARDLLVRIGGAGWFEPIQNQDWRACCLVREALAAASPLADAVFALQGLGTLPILFSENESARERWVDAAIAGRAMAAFAMTEPEAGSDVAAMATTARRDGDSYRLDGTKTYISNAGIADFYTVFAKTGTKESGRTELSAFVVSAKMPGFSVVERTSMMAPHPIGEIAFEGCRVPAEDMVGNEGDGFRLAMETLDTFRSSVGAAACGMARRALDEALRYALTRRQFGRLLAEHQLIQEKLADMTTELDAARLLVYRAAHLKNSGATSVTREASEAKLFATEAACRIVDSALQIHGGMGLVRGNVVERLYRDVRALRIYEGTSEIQKLVIAGQLLKE